MSVRADVQSTKMAATAEPSTFLRELVGAFLADECHRRAASLAYYTMFAIPSLVILTILLGGVIVGETTIEREMTEQATRVFGDDTEEQAREFIEAARQNANFDLSSFVSLGALLIGAIGAFSQLQSAFNAIWNVRPKHDHSGIRHFLRRRAFSLGMLAVVLFLVFIVLGLTVAAAGATTRVAESVEYVPGRVLLILLNGLAVFALTSALFVLMFKVLPDAKLRVRDVWPGAVITALLFLVGQVLMRVWLSGSPMTSTFGAARSLVIVLLWIYYSGIIIFGGAEFTRVLAKWRGLVVEPNEHAERIEIQAHEGGNLAQDQDR